MSNNPHTERCDICRNYEHGCGRGFDCPDTRRAALAAGIPASVIDGKQRLSDVFSQETIEWFAGNETENDTWER